jgi:AAA ATPase-like protein
MDFQATLPSLAHAVFTPLADPICLPADPGLVGRGAELGEVERFLTPGLAGRVLVLWGEPGIGKSTVWQAGVELARSRGFAAWSARPGQAETSLSFAGLADLLEAAGPDVLAGLPGPQRHALEVAVRRAEPDGPPPEPLAVAAGLLGALRLAARAGPVLVAVDDLPWLDAASAAAVVFAARRLTGHDVRFLVARRAGPPSELEQVLEPAGATGRALGLAGSGAGCLPAEAGPSRRPRGPGCSPDQPVMTGRARPGYPPPPIRLFRLEQSPCRQPSAHRRPARTARLRTT